MSDLHAWILALGSLDDAHTDAHGREAFRVRRMRPQVRPLRREEAPRQGAPQAARQTRAQGQQHRYRRLVVVGVHYVVVVVQAQHLVARFDLDTIQRRLNSHHHHYYYYHWYYHHHKAFIDLFICAFVCMFVCLFVSLPPPPISLSFSSIVRFCHGLDSALIHYVTDSREICDYYFLDFLELLNWDSSIWGILRCISWVSSAWLFQLQMHSSARSFFWKIFK